MLITILSFSGFHSLDPRSDMCHHTMPEQNGILGLGLRGSDGVRGLRGSWGDTRDDLSSMKGLAVTSGHCEGTLCRIWDHYKSYSVNYLCVDDIVLVTN